ncbi:glycosyltransferase family protein [Tenacibaculum sp. SG-28]|uniref:glycosyltransferase family protein n=1 Tax=Tenacibaculum sp. SG-28 TaxID=754426 RepID=UPI003518674C
MMKILYAIQGTGNGHTSRAIEILPYLQRKAAVDVLISGYQCDLSFPFEVKYKKYGLSFIFGKKGGVDVWKTIKK